MSHRIWLTLLDWESLAPTGQSMSSLHLSPFLPAMSLRLAVAGRARPLLAATAAALLSLGLMTPAPTAHSAPAVLDLDAAAQQCAVDIKISRDAAKADDVMAGNVDLGSKGMYHLSADPDWKPQAGLDASGNANLHGLDWLLPVLREGLRRHDQTMLDRFDFLLADWRKDVPLRAVSLTGPYSALPESRRLITLVCTLAYTKGQDTLAASMLAEQAAWIGKPEHWQPLNNVHLAQSGALYASAAVLDDAALRQVALARMDEIGKLLILPDGSDKEGAIAYALTNYTWFATAAKRVGLGGDVAPAGLLRYQLIPSLLAAATRPDSRLEAIGDSAPATYSPPVGTPAEWAASGGRSGLAPASLFSTFSGGYVFDRSGWGKGARAFSDETFWSLRTGGASALGPHAHTDTGALTLAAWGAQLLFDSGIYRYTSDSTRAYITSRSAHTALVIPGVVYVTGHANVVVRPLAAGDLVTLTDSGYSGWTVTRTVFYSRAKDFLVVWDSATPRVPVRSMPEQHWQLDRSAAVAVSKVGLDAGVRNAAGVSLRWIGTQPAAVTSTSGATSPMLGWNSQAYGEAVAAPTAVSKMRSGTTSLVTVIVPRRPGVAGSAVTATGTLTAGVVRAQIRTPNGLTNLSLTASAATLTSAPVNR